MFIIKPILYPINQELQDKGGYYVIERQRGDLENIPQYKSQNRILKEILEFVLTKQMQPNQRDIIQKTYRRVILKEKKENWLKLSNFQNSFLTTFSFETNLLTIDELNNSQCIFKLNQIIQHFLSEYIESKRKLLSIENEFVENTSFNQLLDEILSDFHSYKIYKGDVQHCLKALQFYQQSQDYEMNQLISMLNLYIKHVLLPQVDIQQMSIENQEFMLQALLQTFNKWYDKSKMRLTEKLKTLQIQARQAELDIKQYQLEMEELEIYEKRLEKDKDFAEIIGYNKQLQNQITAITKS